MKIVISGVTRGLGRALAEEFIRLGHTVAGCGRGAEGIIDLRFAYGAPHSFDVADVADPVKVGIWAAKVLGFGEAPDLLINNAAIMNRPAPLWQVPPEEAKRLIDINVTGTINVIREFVPPMVAARKGVIINLSSGWGRSVAPEVAPYCASKWAAIPLNPGVIDTDMLRIAWADGASAHRKADAWAKVAAPYILKLGPAENGQSVTVRGFDD
jgi:NAD(P)-dependent dehydrogenase (short-subunit alcohol dehydrogenase family)